MPGYRNHERFIAPHLISCVPATTRGLLYSLPAGYPGVVEGEGIVRGRLLELPERVLGSLDDLEAYESGASHSENEYYRAEVPVRLEDQSEVFAWIYFMTPERVREMNGVRIESGLWVFA